MKILNPHATTISISDLEPARDRHPGIHFSDILRRILRKQDPGRFRGEFDPEFTFAGFLWEEVISAALARMARNRHRYLQQLEIEFRGVWFTIDTFDIKRWRVHEYKNTETSSRRLITEHHFWHWFVQLKAYCLVTDTLEAELWVHFARGDYREKRREAKRWVLRFKKRELEENWVMLDNVRKDMIRKGEVEVLQ